MSTNENNRKAWLTAAQFPQVTPNQWQSAAQHLKLDFASLFDSPNQTELQRLIPSKVWSRFPSIVNQVDKALTFLSLDPSVQCVLCTDSNFPAPLLQLSHPPKALFVKGNIDRLCQTTIAMVGSRNASLNGRKTAYMLASALSEAGIAVASGLARGIDQSSHEGAIKRGNTTAFLGSGIDICYPRSNKQLYDDIVECDGAVVSEFLPGTEPRAHHFPIRNRLVAAISLGVVVVEAKIQSGSLITANLAADLGREVFAVPGNINHPLSAGPNWLIQQGAKLIQGVEDIFTEFPTFFEQQKCTGKSPQNSLASDPLLDSVEYDVTPLDDICKRSRLTLKEVMSALLEYELRGLVAAVPGGYIRLGDKGNVRHTHVSV